MTKQIRLDFSGGVNVIADKSVLPDKFGTVMDNIEVRSGFPRCFKEPIFNHIVADADTTKIFNFRGRWIYSDNWRDYVADYINGIERIYWTESINGVEYDGDGDLAPQKMIEGTEVPLGTVRPTAAPMISAGKTIIPVVNTTQIENGGLSVGSYYYAVSAEFVKGIGLPSNIANVVIKEIQNQDATANIKISWSSIQDAVAYIVWGRVDGYPEMRRLAKVTSALTEWLDIGSATPQGDSPNDYFDYAPVSYVYTYERDVNGVINESGLSNISDRITTNAIRNISRNFLNDGYFSQPTAVNISTDDGYSFTLEPRPSTVDTFPYYEPIDIIGAENDPSQNQVLFTTLDPHRLTTGDQIIFSGSAWTNPAYNNQRYKVIVTSTTQFAILNIPVPDDQILGGLVTDGVIFVPAGGGLDSNGAFSVFTYTGEGSGAVFNVTFYDPQVGPVGSIVDTVTVATAGSGYAIGDVVYIEIQPIPYQGQANPAAIEIGSDSMQIANAGTGYGKPNSIKTLWIRNGGTAYTAGTYTGVALTNVTSSGSGATVNLTVGASGSISNVSLVNLGLDYVPGDVLTATVAGGSGIQFYVFETNSGTYTDVEITGGTGTGAKATLVVDTAGTMAQVEITDGGTGYTGGGTGLGVGLSTAGTPASLNTLLTQTDYVRQYFTITEVNGDSEVSICRSRITISPVPTEGTINNGDAMYLNMSDSAIGRINRINFLGGNGYKDGLYSDIPITGSITGSGATANITVSGGVVTVVDLEDQGLNFVVDDVIGPSPASLNSLNSINTKTLTTPGSGYAGGGSQSFPNVPLTNITGSGQDATAQIVVTSGAVTAVTITNVGKNYVVGNTLSANNANLGGSGSGLVITVNSVYSGAGALITVITIEDAEIINGLYRVYTNDLDGNPIPEGSFDINEYIGAWVDPVELGASAKWVPFNGYYRYWNLYRTGVTGAFQLVDQNDIFTSNYLDTTTTQFLGTTPSSYYTDTGIFGPVQIDFMPPPLGLQSLTSHYGMLFGVDGQRVKWTPIGQPDAWPDVFYYDFTYKPLALSSFGTALIVLCEDAIYRLDGNKPSEMSLSKTNANEGCIAPYTIQKTNKGLIYLSKRGLMVFDGMDAQCITDNRIPSNMLLGPSKLENPVDFWWMPTKLGYFYGNFAFNDGVYYPDESANRFYQTNPIPSAIYDIKSFYHNGRYYLVYTQGYFYEAHTTLCIDLQVEGLPITTLGLKPIDVIVNELDDAYALFGNQGNGDLTNLSNFKAQNSEAEPSYVFAANAGLSTWKLFNGKGNMPLVIRSGQKGFGNTTERRKYGHLEFYGNGTLYVRCYIDGNWIADDTVSLTELPNKERMFNLPKGKRLGYNLDFEAYGDTNRLVVEYVYAEMESPS